jgi:hypothetical protein
MIHSNGFKASNSGILIIIQRVHLPTQRTPAYAFLILSCAYLMNLKLLLSCAY